MKRLVLIIAAAALLVTCIPYLGSASGAFDQRLSQDRQIVHVLNRLTFGPRPGDVEEVRRVGLEKWIDLQLHSERIAENKTLEVRLKPLETLRMPPAQITKEYTQAQMQIVMMNQPFNVMNNLPQEVRRQINNGTAEERKAALGAL